MTESDRRVAELMGIDPERMKESPSGDTLNSSVSSGRRSGSAANHSQGGDAARHPGLTKYDVMVAEQLGIDPERMREVSGGPALNSAGSGGRRSGSAPRGAGSGRAASSSGLTTSDRKVADQLGIDPEKMKRA